MMEKESGKLVETYEKILWKVFLQPAASDKATQNEQDEEKVMKTLAQDASSREEQLKLIVKMGLDKIQKAKKVTEGYEKFFNLVEPFESVIGAELSSVPQVALPWAIVSASLDVSSRRQGLLLLMTKISNRLSEFFSCSQSQRGQIRFYTLE
jgi:N-terminal domain of NWD NACHT-NTPase